MLMLRFALLSSVILASGCEQSSVDVAQDDALAVAALAQCGKDTDCKGDRICESGVCTSPPTTAQVASSRAPQLSQSLPVVEKSNALFKIVRPNDQVTIGRCHMGSCSWAKWKSVKLLSSADSQVVLEATLLGGSSEHEEIEDYPYSSEGASIIWNSEPHTVKVICSREAPSVGDEILPLGSESGVSGAQESAAEVYFVACHSHSDGYPSGIEKFSYAVKMGDL